ncbi:hypothetical protein OAK19_06455 [Aureispira]|nr:hypothetical protein [Aureispira sp.]
MELKLQTLHANNAKNALHLFPAKASGWTAKSEICSALLNTGFEKIWSNINEYQKSSTANGYFFKNRQQQAKYWLEESVGQQLKKLFFENIQVKKAYVEIEKSVIEGKVSPFTAGKMLLELFSTPPD